MEPQKVSDSHKAAMKRYDEKTQTVSIKYTPVDMDDFKKLQSYLERNHLSRNSFIKMLIKDYLMYGKTGIPKPSGERLGDAKIYYPYDYIGEEYLEYFRLKFDEKFINKILEEYEAIVESCMENLVETTGSNFREWVDMIGDYVEEWEQEGSTQEEIKNRIIDSMYSGISM